MSTAPRRRAPAAELPAALALVAAGRAIHTLPLDHPDRQRLAHAVSADIDAVWGGYLDNAVTPLCVVVLDLVRELARALHADEDAVLQALGRQYAGDPHAWTFADRVAALRPPCPHGRPVTADGNGCPDCTGASQ